jgi:uncharacterized protein YcbX
VRTLARISITPVKGFALQHPDEIHLTERGVAANRRFFLVDGDGSRLRSSLTDWPCRVRAEYDSEHEWLQMLFPGGEEVAGDALDLGDEVVCEFSRGAVVRSRIVRGPWEEPVSALAGYPIRLARTPEPGDLYEYPVTLVSEASVARLSEEAGTDVDGRRFRMLFTVAGCDPHEEDEWDGHAIRIGEAVVRVSGPVARCAATTRHPDTGERDLDTLRLIKGYRGQAPDGSILFGMLAHVESPGRVGVGETVELL